MITVMTLTFLRPAFGLASSQTRGATEASLRHKRGPRDIASRCEFALETSIEGRKRRDEILRGNEPTRKSRGAESSGKVAKTKGPSRESLFEISPQSPEASVLEGPRARSPRAAVALSREEELSSSSRGPSNSGLRVGGGALVGERRGDDAGALAEGSRRRRGRPPLPSRWRTSFPTLEGLSVNGGPSSHARNAFHPRIPSLSSTPALGVFAEQAASKVLAHFFLEFIEHRRSRIFPSESPFVLGGSRPA
ncbi:hypothetical protein KM043_008926 [Ampulex compressa]|nr:hypothetical protein KM043_008926 [Ampulex compressa]